ncbi:MAG: ANTAR domain-containing protein [Alphaproteobacteria bacterium]|nr:ANTAR domain-containing protein [Alphaproteobacteria bacterium]MDE2492320.1 ANTAR domain-containing protein [Alphaproteobacteria bacterium]
MIMLVGADDGGARTIEAGLSVIPGTRLVRHESLCDVAAKLDLAIADILILSCATLSVGVIDALRAANTDHPRPIIVFAEQDRREFTDEVIHAGVMSYVVGGLAESRVRPIVEVAVSRFKMFQRLCDERDKAKSDLAARKVIERAKGVLMERNKLSEADAYNTLRRSAMEEGRTIFEIANAVIAVTRLLKV